MNIVEEEKAFGHIGKMRHITISRRDTLVNDLKNSTVQGLISLLLSVLSLLTLLSGVYRSYRLQGNAGYEAGLAAIAAVIIAAGSVVFGIFGLKNRSKIRHYMEKRGIVLSIAVVVFVTVLFITGLGKVTG